MVNKGRGRESIEDYIAYRTLRAEEALRWITPHVFLKGKTVLDIGCGHGSNASVLAKHGARVVGIDIDDSRLAIARQFSSHENIEYVNVDLASLVGRHFDLITVFDVLEHVPEYEQMLVQARNLLAPEGVLYIEYNPYYSIAGHHLYDYTLLPVQFIPYSWTERLVRARAERGGIFSVDDALQQFRGLNGVMCRHVRELCRRHDLRIIFQRNEINIPGYGVLSTRLFRYILYLEDFVSPSHILLLKKK